MKVKISDNEIYNIELKDEISIQELQELLYRLNSLVKVFGKDLIAEVTKAVNSDADNIIPKTYNTRKYEKSGKYKKANKNTNKKSKRPWSGKKEYFSTREKTLDILQIHYHGTQEQREEFLKKYKIGNWDELSKAFFNKRKKHNIKPNEVGMKVFPGKGDAKSIIKGNFRIPGYKIIPRSEILQ